MSDVTAAIRLLESLGYTVAAPVPGPLFGQPKLAPPGTAYPADFSAWWAESSRAWKVAGKVPGSKAEAHRAWLRAKGPPPPVAEWLAGYHRSAAAGIFPGGVPHLCRWIKAKRWEDEWPEARYSEAAVDQRAIEAQEQTRRMLRDQAGA